ncbi:MAG: LysE family translocator [Pseudolabrys sp.]|nr:LysE family translocator [Pseudolabrys sp.]
MNYQLFTAFLLITLILVLTPGPIVTLVIATGATRGARAGLLTVAGSTVGNAILVGAIALGLSLVMQHAAIIFEWLRWIGAAYLIWLGVQAWRHASDAPAAVEPAGHVYFRRGFLAAISNPKTIAFFTAFLPQFIDPTLPAGFQLFVMCSVAIILATFTDAGWAIIAGAGRAFFLKRASAKWLGRICGVALIGGGVWLSLARRPG